MNIEPSATNTQTLNNKRFQASRRFFLWGRLPSRDDYG
jgi:hypothetical protein